MADNSSPSGLVSSTAAPAPASAPTAKTDTTLVALQELPLPAPVSYAPQTVGWLILAGVLLLLALWGAWRWRKRVLANRYREEAMAELDLIEQALQLNDASSAARLPTLIKRVALTAAPRADIAALSGDAWMQWLERTLPAAGFLGAPGRLLPQLAYGSMPAADNTELRALLALTRRWIREHHVHV